MAQALALSSVGAPAPIGLYRFADHLDQVLAYGEDLTALTFLPGADPATDPWRPFVTAFRTREMALMLRLLQARRTLPALASGVGNDTRGGTIKAALSLFAAATAPLAAAAAPFSEGRLTPLEAMHDRLAFLVARGVVPRTTTRLDGMPRVSVTDAAIIAGTMPLNALLDAVAACLDALDAAYGLYPADAELMAMTEACPQEASEPSGARLTADSEPTEDRATSTAVAHPGDDTDNSAGPAAGANVTHAAPLAAEA